MSAVEIISGPAAEPVSRAEAKAHLRVETFADDALIDALIAAARDWIEADTGRDIVQRRRRLMLDCFPALMTTPIRLPRPPARGIVSVKYYDGAGMQQTWSASSYQLDRAAQPARLLPAFGIYWPATQTGRLNAVEVIYRAGHLVAFSADASTDTLAAPDHPFVDGDVVRLSNSGGLLPAPLDRNLDYHVVNATTDALQLATSAGGAAIDLTTTGSGQSFLGTLPGALHQAMLALIAHLYEHREAELAMAPAKVTSLIAPYRVMRHHD